ncbi:MAG: cytochrome C [bacterium]|nr:cytochrome C [bacterium]
MKRLILFSFFAAMLALAGCDQKQTGGTGDDEANRLVTNKPSHSHSPLPCGKCHLRDKPDLLPKMKRVDNVLYLDECGTCHLAYQPELLPKASWDKIMTTLGDHFGEELMLEKAAVARLNNYIMKNAADESKAARSIKVMASLGGAAPMSIMEVPYIKDFHQNITEETIKNKSVRSLANCEACHISAHGGMYIREHIHVPGIGAVVK